MMITVRCGRTIVSGNVLLSVCLTICLLIFFQISGLGGARALLNTILVVNVIALHMRFVSHIRQCGRR